MPNSAVYQPTTVSCHNHGGGMLHHSPTNRTQLHYRLLLLFAVLALIAGVSFLLASVSTLWLNTDEDGRTASQITLGDAAGPIAAGQPSGADAAKEEGEEALAACTNLPMGILISGIVITSIGMGALGVYLRVSNWRHKWRCGGMCPCAWLDKQQSLHNGAGCGQGIMALNPSTDPLVSHTQYAPVSELPSMRVEDEERRNLMPDNKDCLSSAEESDRMLLEPDPRIVLRPMNHIEDA